MPDPFQPQPPAPLTEDDALAELVDEYDEFGPEDVVVVEQPPPPPGRSWSFDFEKSRFRTGAGHSPQETAGLDTIVQWAEKCLRSTRGGSPSYPLSYGVEKRTRVFGKPLAGEPMAAMEPLIRDALTFHPHIASIRDFRSAYDPDDEVVECSFSMVLDDDTLVPMAARLPLPREI